MRKNVIWGLEVMVCINIWLRSCFISQGGNSGAHRGRSSGPGPRADPFALTPSPAQHPKPPSHLGGCGRADVYHNLIAEAVSLHGDSLRRTLYCIFFCCGCISGHSSPLPHTGIKVDFGLKKVTSPFWGGNLIFRVKHGVNGWGVQICWNFSY